MKTNTKEYRRRFMAELETWLCREKGDTRETATYLAERFTAEYGWAVPRMGRQAAVAEWLSGLAICGMPYSNSDILDLYHRLHGEPANGELADRVIDGYWQHCAVQVCRIMEGK